MSRPGPTATRQGAATQHSLLLGGTTRFVTITNQYKYEHDDNKDKHHTSNTNVGWHYLSNATQHSLLGCSTVHYEYMALAKKTSVLREAMLLFVEPA